MKSDGYSLDNHRRKLNTPSDLSKFEEYRKLDKDQAADMLEVGFEIIPLDEVRKKSNILVGSRSILLNFPRMNCLFVMR